MKHLFLFTALTFAVAAQAQPLINRVPILKNQTLNIEKIYEGADTTFAGVIKPTPTRIRYCGVKAYGLEWIVAYMLKNGKVTETIMSTTNSSELSCLSENAGQYSSDDFIAIMDSLCAELKSVPPPISKTGSLRFKTGKTPFDFYHYKDDLWIRTK